MTEREAVNRLTQLFESRKDDNEALHVDADQVLVDFIRANGFHALAAEYDRISEKFWYT